MTASIKDLQALHALLAKDLAERIDNGENVVTKAGAVVTVPASPAVLNVARQLLKDNGIEVEPGTEDADEALASQLRTLVPEASVEY